MLLFLLRSTAAFIELPPVCYPGGGGEDIRMCKKKKKSQLLPGSFPQRRGRKCVTVMAVVALLPLFTRPCLLRAT